MYMCRCNSRQGSTNFDWLKIVVYSRDLCTRYGITHISINREHGNISTTKDGSTVYLLLAYIAWSWWITLPSAYDFIKKCVIKMLVSSISSRMSNVELTSSAIQRPPFERTISNALFKKFRGNWIVPPPPYNSENFLVYKYNICAYYPEQMSTNVFPNVNYSNDEDEWWNTVFYIIIFMAAWMATGVWGVKFEKKILWGWGFRLHQVPIPIFMPIVQVLLIEVGNYYGKHISQRANPHFSDYSVNCMNMWI